MKKIAFYASSLALVLAPSLASAQDASSQNQNGQSGWGNTYETTPQPAQAEPASTHTDSGSGYDNGNDNGNGFGNWNGNQPFSVSVFGQANRGGISASGFMGEQGEAGSATSGSTYSDIGITANSCADCAGNQITGQVTANQHDQGYAIVISRTPGTATVAESIGSSATRVDYGAGFDGNCVGPCQGGQPSSGNTTSD